MIDMDLRRGFSLSFDRQAFYLAGLFLLVAAGSVWLGRALVGAGADPSPPGGVDGPAAGAGLAVLEVGFAIVFIGLLILAKRLPGYLREHIKKIALLGALYTAGAWANAEGVFVSAFAAGVITYTVDEVGLWWIVNNALSVLFAIVGAALLGIVLNEWAIAVFLIGMAVYDRAFADKREYMFQMAGFLVKSRLPVLFVKPATWRFDWDDLLGDEEPDPDDDDDVEPNIVESDTSWGIGTADLLLPAALVVAVVTSDTLVSPEAVAVAVTGGILVAAFRVRKKMLDQGSGAGIPPLATGSIAALVVAVVVSAVYAGVVV